MIEISALKVWLGVTVSTHDDVLTALEARAVATIERELDWYFGEPRDAVEVLDGTGGAVLYLRQPPVDGTVTLASRSGPTGSWTTMDSTDFELDGRALYASGIWTRGVRNYRATYQEGFVAAPQDIEQLVLDLVAALWRGRGREGLASESIGDYAYTVKDLQELPRWVGVLGAWRRGRI
jgi:hypothetical protein